MARLNKSARGKHRWIGITSEDELSRAKLNDSLIAILDKIKWRIYDVENREGTTIFILRVSLDEYQNTISKINSSSSLTTLTSSGKIRLVRERII